MKPHITILLGILFIALAMILIGSVSALQDYKYENIKIKYSYGTFSITEMKIVYDKFPPYKQELIENSTPYYIIIKDGDNNILNKNYFYFSNMFFYDIGDENGSIVGGGSYELNETEFDVDIPFYENASQIIISDYNNTEIIKGNYNELFPNLIRNCTQLQSLGGYNGVRGRFELVSDIDCSDTRNWNNGDGFDPITAYDFILEGNNHVIKNLYSKKGGLFKYISMGEVKNLRMTNVETGSSICDNCYGNITNVHVTGKVNGCGLANMFMGKIKNSSFIGNVYGAGGLLCMQNADGAEILDSYFIGNLIGSYNGAGLAGSVSIIRNSYAIANVTAFYGAAGLAMSAGIIEDSYFIGKIENKYNYMSAGLVGGLGGYIKNCFVIANISSGSVGGIVGGLADGNISDSYFSGNIYVEGGDGIGGGIAGDVLGGKIINCFANVKMKTIFDSNPKGVLVGKISDRWDGWKYTTISEIKNSYYYDYKAYNNVYNYSYSLANCIGIFGTRGIVNCTPIDENRTGYFYSIGNNPIRKWDFYNSWKKSDTYPILQYIDYCGDKECTGNENCTNCAYDCGACGSALLASDSGENSESSAGGSGSSGSSGIGGSLSRPYTGIYINGVIANKSQINEGLGIGENIGIDINGSKYNLIISSINQESVTLTSDYGSETINVGEGKDIDINNDNKNDVYIKVNEIRENRVFLTITNLALSKITGLNSIIYFIIIGIIVAVIIIIWIFLRKKHQ